VITLVGPPLLVAAIAIVGVTGVLAPSTDPHQMHLPLASPSVAATADGKIYVFGSDLVAVYTAATAHGRRFRATSLVSTVMGAVQAGGGKIYLVGGPASSSNGLPPATVLVFDPATNSRATQTDLLEGKQSPSAVAMNSGDLYVIGGNNGFRFDSSVEEATIPDQ